jgi:hypothetical protein
VFPPSEEEGPHASNESSEALRLPSGLLTETLEELVAGSFADSGHGASYSSLAGCPVTHHSRCHRVVPVNGHRLRLREALRTKRD